MEKAKFRAKILISFVTSYSERSEFSSSLDRFNSNSEECNIWEFPDDHKEEVIKDRDKKVQNYYRLKLQDCNSFTYDI